MDDQGTSHRLMEQDPDSRLEVRKIGKVHAMDAPLEDVINQEMARI
jgi:hypothetical protein